MYLDEILGLEHVKLFEDFSNDEIKALCRHMMCYVAPRDFSLLTEGTEGDFLLLILTGQVSVLKQMESGENRPIAIAEPGMSLGEMSLIDGCPRFASCVTMIPTDFAVLSRSSLNEILVQMPRLGNKLLLVLLQLMTLRLRDTTLLLFPRISDTYI